MDDLQVHNVAATVHGRYLARPAPGGAPAPLLVGFHGYGENAERLFEAIIEIPGIVDWNVMVVQALHPFYNRRNGDVVASWMTRLDRELAIADNVDYIGRALAHARSRIATTRPTVFLGFSQGAAMAYRAAAAPNSACDGVIALAGDVPPDLEAGSATGMRVLIGRGRSDQWYNEAKLETDLARLRSLGAEVDTCVFDGGHRWTAEFRTACREFLRAVRS